MSEGKTHRVVSRRPQPGGGDGGTAENRSLGASAVQTGGGCVEWEGISRVRLGVLGEVSSMTMGFGGKGPAGGGRWSGAG